MVKIGSCEINVDEVRVTVKEVLSRNQLRDVIFLNGGNEAVHIHKLVCYVLLQGDEYLKPDVLKKFGLGSPVKKSLQEEAKIACMERCELVEKVLAFIK